MEARPLRDSSAPRAVSLIALTLILLEAAACSRAFPDDGSVLAATMLATLSPPGANDSGANGGAAIKKIFLSNAQPGGNMGGVTGADALCDGDANKPDGATYKALLVDGANRRACVNANCTPTNGGDGLDWVFQPNATYYRDDGGGNFTAVIATNASRVAAFPLATNGFSASGANEYWTGLETDWTVAFSGVDLDCANWAGAGSGQTGIGGSASSDAVSFGTPLCAIAGSYHLLCVEQ
jgi:hypothetical protein